MKNFDSRTYSINDFIEWDDKGQLILNPAFQRGDVWSENARSYLMDSIIRGKPIPKVFIRQNINPTTKKSTREVVDGQQRLRTILSYVRDGFFISKKHHSKFGGLLFSQLADVDPDIQTAILNYEISVDLLVNLPDSEVLDIFSRLNAYAVTLNEQEKINAAFFGPFKVLADSLGHDNNTFWFTNKILTPKEILRMADVGLAADLLIAITTGIKSKKQIKSSYARFEDNFNFDSDLLKRNFANTLSFINSIFTDGLAKTEFSRIHLFYSLFVSVYHGLHGIPGLPACSPLQRKDPRKTLLALSEVDEIFKANIALPKLQKEFLEDSRRATTDAVVRVRRSEYLLKKMGLM
ncbi:MAG: DUF262 domain-containing protein [Pseudomonadota bacterium]